MTTNTKKLLAFVKGLVAGAIFLSLLTATAHAHEHPLSKKRRMILGQEMAYIDEGQGRPVVFLHGNPTSSYLWRNIIPYVSQDYRVIAPDLIGMGDSGKPDIHYDYTEQARYLHQLLDELDLNDAVLVVHDWGSALGFHYARTRSDRISAIAFMEATLPPDYPIPSLAAMGPSAEFLRNVRTPGIGETMILEQNFLIDQFLRAELPEGAQKDEIIAEYNRYYPTEESRKPLLQWLRAIPIGGHPAKVHDIGLLNNQWLLESDIPKLLFHVTPGVLVGEATVTFMTENASNLDVIELGPGGHFLQETYSDEIGKGLANWLGKIE